MLVFLDAEASSLAKHSYPIEVARVFADGRSESSLMVPAPGWTDWDAHAEAIHRIDRETLLLEGMPHEAVAQRMIEVLARHDLLASAPSCDGKWLSALLRAAGLPRHSLRLRRADDALRECAATILSETVPRAPLENTVDEILARYDGRATGRVPAHRALPDAEAERDRWLAVRAAAHAFAIGQSERWAFHIGGTAIRMARRDRRGSQIAIVRHASRFSRVVDVKSDASSLISTYLRRPARR